MPFRPAAADSPPPPLGKAHERATVDFKSTVSEATPFHLAKDVAAFANHLGGTIYVGVAEGVGGTPEAYVPLDAAAMGAAQDKYSKALQRCSPAPVIDFERIATDGGHILAVNVWPFIGQIVGVEVKSHKPDEGWGGAAHAFPIRAGADTIFIKPEQLPMFIEPQVRRTVILLNGIPVAPRGGMFLLWRNPRNGFNEAGIETPLARVDVDVQRNVMQARISDGLWWAHVPLDDVESVWDSHDDRWVIRVRGMLQLDARRYISNPTNAVFRS